MALTAGLIYTGKIHRAKWSAYDKGDGTRGQSLRFRVQVEGSGFADGDLFFTPAAVEKSYERVQEVIGKTLDREEFMKFMADPAPLLVGVLCQITTKLDDRGQVVVQWLNADGLAGKPMNEKDRAAILARIFDKQDDPFSAGSASDDDVPF